MITADEALVHSSGHPRQGELQQMYGWVKPKALVPMHGEPRHLRAHAKFAEEHGIADTLIPEDGKILRLAPGPLAIVDEAPAGILHVDGKLIVPGSMDLPGSAASSPSWDWSWRVSWWMTGWTSLMISK